MFQFRHMAKYLTHLIVYGSVNPSKSITYPCHIARPQYGVRQHSVLLSYDTTLMPYHWSDINSITSVPGDRWFCQEGSGDWRNQYYITRNIRPRPSYTDSKSKGTYHFSFQNWGNEVVYRHYRELQTPGWYVCQWCPYLIS